MKKIVYITLLACFTLVSCEDFLNREPIAEIGSGEYFKNESSLKTYTNGFLQSYVPSTKTLGFGDGVSDIMLTKESTAFLTSTSWTANNQGGWSKGSWTPISNINYFLVHMHEARGVTAEAAAHYEGTARFWRAWQYFDKVQAFGAVPWYSTPIDPSDEEALYKTRDSREFVMEKVLEDLNFACDHCYANQEWVNTQKINKYIALAIKSRICLYEGTYRKYHTVDPSTGQPWVDQSASARFLKEAAQAAKELMDAGEYAIVNNPANVKTQYRQLFTSEKVDHTEVIWAREMNSSLSVFHDLTWYFTSGSMGDRWSLDGDFVNTYLNRDGSRFTETTPAYNKTPYQEEFTNRDYRLSQCIVSPEYKKLVGGVSRAVAPSLAISLNGYQVIKYNIDDTAYESATICWNSLPIIRYAEVLLNYAEAKAELGEFNDEIWNHTIKPLRERAGVDGTRPTTLDVYLQTYYAQENGGKISDKDILEIRRERAIELLLEGLRYDDLMRWHLGHLLNKPWSGIYIDQIGKPYDLNNDGVNDLCLVNSVGEVGSETGVYYVVLDGSYSLENGTSGRLMYNITRNFEEKRYLRPIPQTALEINPELGQNYYWK